MTRPAAAVVLGLAPRTLAGWDLRWTQDRLPPTSRGRPAKRAPLVVRNEALAEIAEHGPHLGVPSLCRTFPDLGRREAEDLVARSKRLTARLGRLALHVLTWYQPGRVWAADFSKPPRPIDGTFAALFAVRDLASHCQLGWWPAPDESAKTAVAFFTELFCRYGPPLVLKCDNGSAFIAEALRDLLERWAIENLLSPARMPEYNGSCEAGNGSMETRTRARAARRGWSEWSADDCETARALANATARPWGFHRPTPDQAWAARTPITPDERAQFRARVARYALETRIDRGLALDLHLDRPTQASLDRCAIRRALVALGLLSIRRGRFPLPIHSRFSANIS